jgi:hypothetical protein
MVPRSFGHFSVNGHYQGDRGGAQFSTRIQDGYDFNSRENAASAAINTVVQKLVYQGDAHFNWASTLQEVFTPDSGLDKALLGFAMAAGNYVGDKLSEFSEQQEVQSLMEVKKLQELKERHGIRSKNAPASETDKQALIDAIIQRDKVDQGDPEALAAVEQDADVLIGAKRTTDDINQILSGMSKTDEDYDSLAKISKMYTAMLMNRDIYFQDSASALLPEGVSRMDDAALVKAGTSMRNSDFVSDGDDGSGYFGALYSDSNFASDSGLPAYTYVNRGTNFTSFIDWKNNGGQGLGLFSKQYDQAITIGRRLYKELNGGLQFSGHSLGGGLAASQALATGGRGITFNAAGVSDGTMRRYDLNRDYAAGIAAFNVGGEILSGLQDSYLVDAAAAVYGSKGKNALATVGLLGNMLNGESLDFAGFGVGYFPSASGNRIEMPATDLQGNEMSGLQKMSIGNSVALHGMGYVASSTNYLFDRGELTSGYLKNISYH